MLTCISGCIDIGNITAQTITGGDGATVIFSSHQDATFTCQLDSGTAVTCKLNLDIDTESTYI